ncbi:MAG TPA: hypothetical protein V6D28_22030 [Leptolyngbyaceae cyanobacterium]
MVTSASFRQAVIRGIITDGVRTSNFQRSRSARVTYHIKLGDRNSPGSTNLFLGLTKILIHDKRSPIVKISFHLYLYIYSMSRFGYTLIVHTTESIE